eukprot:4388020-Pleurochrysis_carterae.AAC.1
MQTRERGGRKPGSRIRDSRGKVGSAGRSHCLRACRAARFRLQLVIGGIPSTRPTSYAKTCWLCTFLEPHVHTTTSWPARECASRSMARASASRSPDG